MALEHAPSDSSSSGDDYFRHYLNRTIMLLGEEAVQTLRGKTVAIAGCGGQGGAACLTLARMGVGGFILADPKPFDEPDINRQWGANLSTLGRNKAEVYAEMLLAINPEIRIKKFCDGITDANVPDFLSGADLLVDCLDIAVPGELRAQVFATASALGMHMFTGAMLGFGGMVAGSCPGGIPLEVLGAIEDAAISGSKIPAGIREVFVPEFMDRIEEFLPIHRAPSIAISPALLGTLLSVESLVALLGNTIPGWRPPICLPHVLLVDLLKMNFKVVHLDDLLGKGGAAAAEISSSESRSGSKAPPAAAISRGERRALLASVGYNTNLLPDDSTRLDLLTDSWHEIAAPEVPVTDGGGAWPLATAEQAIRGLYDYAYVVPVFRGRFAEALLCQALGKKGSIAITNGLFPTTRFHLEANGFTTQDLLTREAYDLGSSHPFKGNLDVERLKEILAAGSDVGVVYIELCVNSLGGHPVSVANMLEIRELANAHKIPVILDPARAFENAALIRQRESGFAGRTLVSIVQQICKLTDACASSCAKDFRCREGGFIGTHDRLLFGQVCDLSLAFGDGLNAGARRNLVQALSMSPETSGSEVRTGQVRRLWEKLSAISVPVVAPAGGHAIFIDAQAFLPHISPSQYPAQALSNELFVTGGIRAGVNFITPDQRSRDLQLLRLAVPVHYCDDAELEEVIRAFQEISASRENLKGLRKVDGPAGVAAEFAAVFEPLNRLG